MKKVFPKWIVISLATFFTVLFCSTLTLVAQDNFCAIFNGTKPAIFIQRSSDLMVIEKNMKPRSPADVLIIPKEHIADFTDIDFDNPSHQNLIKNIWKTVLELRAQLQNPQAAFQLFINHGSNRGIDHLHVHFLAPSSNWCSPTWVSGHQVNATGGRKAADNNHVPYSLSIDRSGDLFLSILKTAKAEAGVSSTFYFDCEENNKGRAWILKGSEIVNLSKGSIKSPDEAMRRSPPGNNEPTKQLQASLFSTRFWLGACIVAAVASLGAYFFFKPHASSGK